MTQAQKLISGTTYTVGYGYNLAGELTAITYPSGRVVERSFDAIGRLTTILSGATNYASGYSYNPAFEVTGFNYGNGVTASFGYSPERLLLQTVSYSTATQTLFSLSYGYAHANGGKNGQITNITDNLDAGRTVNYTYDALYRVSTALTTGSASYPQWGLSWTYDRYGNRTQQTVTAGTAPSNSLSISATSNRITSTGFTYDLSGNLTQEGSASLQYTYDAENRMVSFNSGTATYTYVGAQRAKKVSGSTTTVYVFSGSKVIAEYVNAALSKEYVYAGGSLLATLDSSGTPTYRHNDHLSARLETNSSAGVSRTFGQYPFGEAWYETGTASKWKFTSYERDSESGLDYAIFRNYNSRLGRFTSADLLAGSLTRPQSLNRYVYAADDPVNLYDPLGLMHDCLIYAWVDSGAEGIGGYQEGYLCGGGGFPRDEGRPNKGGGEPRQVTAARKQALKLLTKEQCQEFIQNAIKDAFDLLNAAAAARFSFATQAVRDAQQEATKIESFTSQVQKTTAIKDPTLSQHHVAEAGLFTFRYRSQLTGLTFIHEVLHLGAYGFLDSVIADAVGAKYAVVPRDPQKTEENASAAWHQKLKEACGP